ncbi:hypothetical protein RB195_008383 [Necator americanus]|uniref:Endonuclease/exonuclease/phosphatase domain-containing protein n=1 Tax=Necator americanus TaxID=51031 RepID=A0ABR1CP68_NECAM
MQAVHELLTQRQASLNMYGLSIRQIMTLIDECLNCSIFRWSGQYYRQLRGLAMGQRLAPTLAIVFMAKTEKPIIDRKPLLYYRYIDYCCVVCSTQAELDTCFNLLNQQCPHIKFTKERLIDSCSVIKQPHRRRSPMIYGLEKWKAPPTMIEKLVCMEEARAYPRSDTHCPRPGIVANMRGLPARGRSRPKKLILHRQQHPVRLATLNVGTLTGRSRELADSLRKRRVDICCVQETRWKGSKSRELGDGYKLIYHGTSNRNGVGIILNESFRNSVTAVDRLLDRLMIVKVDTGEVESRVVSAYAPQMGCSEEEKMCFWEDLLVHLLVMDLKISRPRKRHPRTETQRIKWWNLKDRKEIFLRPWLHLRFPTLLVVWSSTSSVIGLTAENTLEKTTLGRLSQSVL